MNQVFTTERHGYSPQEVDSYILELQSLIDQRNREIREYKAKEAQIQKSQDDARIEAQKILDQAQQDAEMIISDARSYSERMRKDAYHRLEDIRQQVLALSSRLEGFKSAYENIIQQYLISAKANELSALFADLNQFMNQLGLSKEEEPVNIAEIAVRKKR